MDIASLAAKAELHALPAPLVPYLEPTTTTTDRTPPNHYLHAGRKGRKVVGMSQASATGATVEPWADQTPAEQSGEGGVEDMEVEGDDKELSPEGDERVMEGESVEEGGEEEEEEEEDEGPPPRPGRRVKFEQRDRLAVEFEERNMCQRNPDERAQDMIQDYQRECGNMRVKPVTKLLEQLERLDDLTTPIDTLDLKGVKLDNASCEVLETVLSRVHANSLDLEKANLEDEGAIALCEMVEFYGCTSKLNLAHNHRLRPRAWLTIGRTLKKSPFLTMVNVSYCALEEQTLTLLLRSVRANCYLQVLKMEGNNLTGKGTFILMAAMKFNENLQELWLGANHLGPEDGQHLGSILRSNHTLRVLDVRENNLQDQGVRYICAGVAEQQEGLFVLNLSSNGISPDGIHHVSAMLPCTRSLRELNISYNRCGDNGLFMLKLGLLANRSLDKLNLCNIKMTDEGAIALAEVLAENKHISHLDLRENDVRVAGLMGLQLAHRMNHALLHMDTPKSYKVDQRDRGLIKDLLMEVDRYCTRNLKEREEKAELERRRQHEAQHAQLVAAQKSLEETQQFTAGGSLGGQADEEEEEKEVDPSLVGSLDNVYTEAPGTMPGEDPFKREPMMVDNEKPSNLKEMEKNLEAMEASIDQESSQELDSSDDMSSLDVAGMRRPRAKQMDSDHPCSRISSPPLVFGVGTGAAAAAGRRGGGESEHRVLNQQRLAGEGEEEMEGVAGRGGGTMPDLLASGLTTPPDIQLSSQPAPDVTAHSRSMPLPPDIATAAAGTSSGHLGSSRESGSLHTASTRGPSSQGHGTASPGPPSAMQPLDLTDGLLGLQVGEREGRRGET